MTEVALQVTDENRVSLAMDNQLVIQDGMASRWLTDGWQQGTIEADTIVESIDGSWSHPVKMKDKNIVIRDTSGNKLGLRVIDDRKPAETAGHMVARYPGIPRREHIVWSPQPMRLHREPPRYPHFIINTADQSVSMLTPFKLVLPNDYSCRAIPFTSIYVHTYTRTRARPVGRVSGSEAIALECLREMITEDEYRKYLSQGFIMVKGASGKVYQVWRGARSHTHVWENGKKLEEICVYVKDSKVPPTDQVVALKTMVETDEEELRRMANVFTYREAV